MSTPEQPDSPPLTRKQMREIRNTGATPVIDTGAVPVVKPAPAVDSAPADEAEAPSEAATPPPPPHVEASLPPVVSVPPAVPLPRPAEPVVLPEPPGPDRAVDLGVSPLTRRQARQQERIRTASVPVITPDISAAYLAQQAGDVAPPPSALEPVVEPEAEEDPFAALGVVSGPISQVPQAVEPEPEPEPDLEPEAQPEPEPEAEPEQEPEAEPEVEAFGGAEEAPQEPARTVAPDFGAALLAGGGDEPVAAPSFEELVTRSSSGSIATPNALIISQSPDAGPIVAPLTGTGEVLITGTFNLPEGLGSTGHAPGVADGKEVDAVLVDGELPAHSSPTPIAASSAVSTTKTPGEIIKPPAPEKGGRLMLTLAITAGVLALALVGVLILAFATGVF
ncbi:hypothetical protein ABZ477_02675 [Microbacterium sp. NPDC019599]|uniref:hypothetical protein n=1 Tax=Microbacterium sp. NPDC019599 TaxID=3154690 RepID=UPI0033C6B061